MMSAAAVAVMIIAVVIVTVTVVATVLAAASAVMMRNFDVCRYKFHLESESFSCKRMVGIEINRVAFDPFYNNRNNIALIALHLENRPFVNICVFREFRFLDIET